MTLQKHLSVLLFLTLLFLTNKIHAQIYPEILTLKQEANWIDSTLQLRFEQVIPLIMRRENVDLWIVTAREYNEDPVIRTMLPATWFAARRRTMLVFWDNGTNVERLAVSRYDIGTFFKKIWNPEENPDQIGRLVDFIKEKKPKKIALNTSKTFAQADGITKTEFDQIQKKLGKVYQNRIVSGEKLAVGWLETRIPAEVEMMQYLAGIGHDIIKNGFSGQVVVPGETTTEDVQWWFREEIRRLGFGTWFHPSVSLQRAENPGKDGDFSSKPDSKIIQKGDLLHVDIGVTFARFNTDQQQHAYVLKAGETQVPEGLQKALKTGNRLQDILMSNFKIGLSGNIVLKNSREQAINEGIKPSIYTHPLGFYGHASGPTIGMWDNQGDTKGAGDYPVFANTGYSIELNVSVQIPEWNNKEIRIMLEEDAFFDGKSVRFYDGRQEDIILID
jgi:Xaa-Pro aminopeptidase